MDNHTDTQYYSCDVQTDPSMSSAQVQTDVITCNSRPFMAQYPSTKKKGSQTIKVPVNIQCIQTDTIDNNDKNTEYDYPDMSHIGTLTDDPKGVDKCVATENPIGRHIQTDFVRCANKKTGRSTHHAQTQYKYRFTCKQSDLCQYEQAKDNLKMKLASQIAARAADIKAKHIYSPADVT